MAGKKSKLMIYFLGFLVLVGIAGLGGVKITSSPGFCTLCHEILPEYTTWKASSHSRVTCIKCHQRPGVRNFITEKKAAIGQLYRHFAQEFYLPIASPQIIENSICLTCHNMKRPVTAKGDIKMNHQKHLNRKINCVECHSGVAHGRIAERQLTIDAAWDRWNEAYAKVQMNPQFTSLQMKDCVNCHSIKKAPLNCETCHKEILKPNTHMQANWGTNHGQDARKDIDSCDRCHSFTKEFVVASFKDPVTEYARTNQLCYTCHLKLPPSHNLNWKKNHSGPAESNKEGCLICHSYQPARKDAKATKTNCQSCHRQLHKQFNRQVHPIPLPEGTKLQQICIKCHSKSNCGKCHAIDFLPTINPVRTNPQPIQG